MNYDGGHLLGLNLMVVFAPDGSTQIVNQSNCTIACPNIYGAGSLLHQQQSHLNPVPVQAVQVTSLGAVVLGNNVIYGSHNIQQNFNQNHQQTILQQPQLQLQHLQLTQQLLQPPAALGFIRGQMVVSKPSFIHVPTGALPSGALQTGALLTGAMPVLQANLCTLANVVNICPHINPRMKETNVLDVVVSQQVFQASQPYDSFPGGQTVVIPPQCAPFAGLIELPQHVDSKCHLNCNTTPAIINNCHFGPMTAAVSPVQGGLLLNGGNFWSGFNQLENQMMPSLTLLHPPTYQLLNTVAAQNGFSGIEIPIFQNNFSPFLNSSSAGCPMAASSTVEDQQTSTQLNSPSLTSADNCGGLVSAVKFLAPNICIGAKTDEQLGSVRTPVCHLQTLRQQSPSVCSALMFRRLNSQVSPVSKKYHPLISNSADSCLRHPASLSSMATSSFSGGRRTLTSCCSTVATPTLFSKSKLSRKRGIKMSSSSGPCKLDRSDCPRKDGSLELKSMLCTIGKKEATPFVLGEVKVPYCWRRVVIDGMVQYYSPSDICLSSCKDISAYLLRSDTCKCGLECPLMVGEVFSFDPHVEGIPFSLGDIPQSGDLSKLCSHRRNVLSMAPFFSTAAAHDASAPESDGPPIKSQRCDDGTNPISSPFDLKQEMSFTISMHSACSQALSPVMSPSSRSPLPVWSRALNFSNLHEGGAAGEEHPPVVERTHNVSDKSPARVESCGFHYAMSHSKSDSSLVVGPFSGLSNERSFVSLESVQMSTDSRLYGAISHFQPMQTVGMDRHRTLMTPCRQPDAGLISTGGTRFGGSSTPGTRFGVSSTTGTLFGGSSTPGTQFGGCLTPGTRLGGSSTPETQFGGSSTPGTQFGGSSTPGTQFWGSSTTGTPFGGSSTPRTQFGGSLTPVTRLGGSSTPGTQLGGSSTPGTQFGGRSTSGTQFGGSSTPSIDHPPFLPYHSVTDLDLASAPENPRNADSRYRCRPPTARPSRSDDLNGSVRCRSLRKASNRCPFSPSPSSSSSLWRTGSVDDCTRYSTLMGGGWCLGGESCSCVGCGGGGAVTCAGGDAVTCVGGGAVSCAGNNGITGFARTYLCFSGSGAPTGTSTTSSSSYAALPIVMSIVPPTAAPSAHHFVTSDLPPSTRTLASLPLPPVVLPMVISASFPLVARAVPSFQEAYALPSVPSSRPTVGTSASPLLLPTVTPEISFLTSFFSSTFPTATLSTQSPVLPPPPAPIHLSPSDHPAALHCAPTGECRRQRCFPTSTRRCPSPRYSCRALKSGDGYSPATVCVAVDRSCPPAASKTVITDDPPLPPSKPDGVEHCLDLSKRVCQKVRLVCDGSYIGCCECRVSSIGLHSGSQPITEPLRCCTGIACVPKEHDELFLTMRRTFPSGGVQPFFIQEDSATLAPDFTSDICMITEEICSVERRDSEQILTPLLLSEPDADASWKRLQQTVGSLIILPAILQNPWTRSSQEVHGVSLRRHDQLQLDVDHSAIGSSADAGPEERSVGVVCRGADGWSDLSDRAISGRVLIDRRIPVNCPLMSANVVSCSVGTALPFGQPSVCMGGGLWNTPVFVDSANGNTDSWIDSSTSCGVRVNGRSVESSVGVYSNMDPTTSDALAFSDLAHDSMDTDVLRNTLIPGSLPESKWLPSVCIEKAICSVIFRTCDEQGRKPVAVQRNEDTPCVDGEGGIKCGSLSSPISQRGVPAAPFVATAITSRTVRESVAGIILSWKPFASSGQHRDHREDQHGVHRVDQHEDHPHFHKHQLQAKFRQPMIAAVRQRNCAGSLYASSFPVLTSDGKSFLSSRLPSPPLVFHSCPIESGSTLTGMLECGGMFECECLGDLADLCMGTLLGVSQKSDVSAPTSASIAGCSQYDAIADQLQLASTVGQSSSSIAPWENDTCRHMRESLVDSNLRVQLQAELPGSDFSNCVYSRTSSNGDVELGPAGVPAPTDCVPSRELNLQQMWNSLSTLQFCQLQTVQLQQLVMQQLRGFMRIPSVTVSASPDLTTPPSSTMCKPKFPSGGLIGGSGQTSTQDRVIDRMTSTCLVDI